MIRVEKTHLPVAALTHPGMKGKNNEDRFGVSAFRTQAQPPVPVLLAVLSDGIGGNRAGEVASELAVNLIIHHAAESDGKNPPQIMEEAIHNASEQIRLQAQEKPEQHGMGATCACVWIAGDRLYTATVGDSRIYLMRGEAIYQLSVDHTWIQEALERGLIQSDQVNGHPNAHVIRRYLGSPALPEVDFRLRMLENGGPTSDETPAQASQNQGMRLQTNDRLLLCSDGLTDLVSGDEIRDAFGELSLEEAGQHLINLANQRGGHDNITLVSIEIPDQRTAAVPPAAASRPARPRALVIGCLAVILLAVLAGGLAGTWLLYGDKATPTPTGTLQDTPTVTFTSPPGTRTPTRTPGNSPTPFGPQTENTLTAAPAEQGTSATLTPWPTNTPRLPIVTVSP